jgi:hypothetical protein
MTALKEATEADIAAAVEQIHSMGARRVHHDGGYTPPGGAIRLGIQGHAETTEEEAAAGVDSAAAVATEEIVSFMRAMASNPKWQQIVGISEHIASNFCETCNVANGDGAAKRILDRTHPQNDGLYQHLKETREQGLGARTCRAMTNNNSNNESWNGGTKGEKGIEGIMQWLRMDVRTDGAGGQPDITTT